MEPQRSTATLLFGRYRLEAVLGTGGMGTVYRATVVSTGQVVAVKVLHANLAQEREFRERFEREARVMAKLDHPNLVPLLGVERDDEACCLVMKLVEGQSLAARIRERGRLTARETVPVVAQLASGLDYLHARGLVHRDVKPSNVLLSPEGHVTLLDFGLSRPVGLGELTKPGSLVGTPEYMAPEQTLDGPIDHRADVYAVGALAYRMLTGALPIGAPTDFELLRRLLEEVPQLANERSPAVSEAMARALARALTKNPADRYDSVLALSNALAEAVALDRTDTSTEHEASRAAQEAGRTLPSLPSLPSLSPVTEPLPARAAPPPARRWGWWAVAGTLAVLGAAALAWVLRGG